MKKINAVIIIVSIFLFISLLFNILFENKSVTIDLINDDQTYYVTLLSNKKESGPWVLNSKYVETYQTKYKSVWEKFEKYDDDYYFIGNISQLSNNESFIWGYHCPENFKVLIYSPLEDKFFESKKINSLFAKNYFITKIVDNELRLSTPFNGIPYDVISIIVRFFSILIIEVAIAYIFKLRSKENMKGILKANIVSYILILFLLQLLEIKNLGIYLGLILCFKVISYIAKNFIYNSSIKNNKKYCLSANLVSFTMLELINILLFCS